MCVLRRGLPKLQSRDFYPIRLPVSECCRVPHHPHTTAFHKAYEIDKLLSRLVKTRAFLRYKTTLIFDGLPSSFR
jgi:hypothetical protein